MPRGIIYCMTTIVPGLVKIGKTGLNNFETRMYNLEHNGYVQIGGLKRKFAIEVDDYDEKETLIQELLITNRVGKTELFAIDSNLVVQLLSSFEGKQIYPKYISKEDVFNIAADEAQINTKYPLPDGKYYISEKIKKFGTLKATMKVENGKFIVLKGSRCLSSNSEWMPELRKNAKIENGILMEDVECKSPSSAGWVVLGYSNNGWLVWKNENGQSIDIFRNKANEDKK